jgi:hypothetical protein
MMNAVTTEEQNTNKSASLEALRNFASQKEGQVRKFEKSLVDAERRAENFAAERGSLLIPARSENDAKAQKRLSAIDAELAVLRPNIADDRAVLADLKAQLAAAQESVMRAEWELRRASVRAMIARRLSGKTAVAIRQAVDALNVAMRTAQEEDEAIRVATLEFEPSLGRDLRTLKMAGHERSRLASWKLRNVLLVDSREFGFGIREGVLEKAEFEAYDRRFYGELLERLGCLELVF